MPHQGWLIPSSRTRTWIAFRRPILAQLLYCSLPGTHHNPHGPEWSVRHLAAPVTTVNPTLWTLPIGVANRISALSTLGGSLGPPSLGALSGNTRSGKRSRDRRSRAGDTATWVTDRKKGNLAVPSPKGKGKSVTGTETSTPTLPPTPWSSPGLSPPQQF